MLEEMGKLIIAAMKAKEVDRLKVLRYLKSLLLENKTAKKPIEEMDVIIKHHKRLSDSLELYKSDQARLDEIKGEIKVVSEFMPKQLTEEDVVNIISKIKSSLENPNMGSIMKELSPQIKGQFDGKIASQLVKNSLS